MGSHGGVLAGRRDVVSAELTRQMDVWALMSNDDPSTLAACSASYISHDGGLALLNLSFSGSFISKFTIAAMTTYKFLVFASIAILLHTI